MSGAWALFSGTKGLGENFFKVDRRGFAETHDERNGGGAKVEGASRPLCDPQGRLRQAPLALGGGTLLENLAL